MKIKWLGHSCFLITTSSGKKILTDPYDDSIGYKIGKVDADIVTSSHDHFDHNYIQRVRGTPKVVNKTGETQWEGILFKGISSFHDKSNGRERGSNIVFVFTADSINICHLGDLGHILTPTQVEQIGKVDILLVPVGGVYTIDAHEATKVVEQLNPKIIIPMHYKTKDLKLEIASKDKFLAGKPNVRQIKDLEVEISSQTIPPTPEIWVLNY